MGTSCVLPQPRLESGVALEQCLFARRSVRSYRPGPLTLAEAGQLLWAAQGITAEGELRTAPSAGALYPLETYLIAGKVKGIAPGVHHYRPGSQDLVLVKPGDLRQELAEAAIGQDCIREGAITILIAAVYARTRGKYRERAARYVLLEAGHAAQNVCLQATALGLSVVTVGAFHDHTVKNLAALPQNEDPIYLLPAGREEPARS
jgi:SagB-type dehydrogenase family enzyme